MLSKSVLLLASAALSLASPLASRQAGGCPAPNKPTPQLPLTGGPKELPAPPPGTALKHIALGFGIQNYSCSSTTATPSSTGALAILYDVTQLFPGQSAISLSPSDFNNLSTFALFHHDNPLNLLPLSSNSTIHNAGGASDPFPADHAPLSLPNLDGPLPFLGHHFFDQDANPVFDLDHSALHIVAAKDASVDAPSSASTGLDDTGAVAWLRLSAKPGSPSRGASTVYRVVTAGGNSHGCDGADNGEDSTPYAAFYWFFG